MRHFFNEGVTVQQGGVEFQYRAGQFYIVPEEHLEHVMHAVEEEHAREERLVAEAAEVERKAAAAAAPAEEASHVESLELN